MNITGERMNIEVHRRLNNTLVHTEGKPHGGGALHEFLPYLHGKPARIEVAGMAFDLSWDSEDHAIGSLAN